jgi:tripartite-type tricarboxylate transporter receptor subunit TctC
LLGESPLAIVAHPSLAASSPLQLIELARQQGGKLSYGTPGNGTPMHFAAETFVAQSGISMLHIPYRGGAAALTDLLGGQIPLAVVGVPPAVPYAKSGKLRVIAVTGDKRSPALPDVPAVAELAGFAGYRFTNWMGLYAPARTPQQLIAELAATAARILREPQTREKLMAQGVEPVGNSPTEFGAFIRAERERYSRIAKQRNIRGDV